MTCPSELVTIVGLSEFVPVIPELASEETGLAGNMVETWPSELVTMVKSELVLAVIPGLPGASELRVATEVSPVVPSPGIIVET